MNVFLLENKKLTEQLNEVERKCTVAREDYNHTAQQYEQIKIEYDVIQTQIEELEQQIESNRDALTQASVTRGKLEGEMNVLKEQVKGLQGNEQHFRERLTVIQEQIASREVERTKILTNKVGLDERTDELTKERNKVKNVLFSIQKQIEERNHQIEESKNRIIILLNDRATIKSKLSSFDTMMEQLRIRKAELNSRLLRAKSDEAERDIEIKLLREEFQKINDQIVETNAQLRALEKHNTTFREQLSSKDREISENQVIYQRCKSQLDTISNLTERYEGYGNSIQKVMEQKEQNKGIVGVVADIIKVDKEYETAIEIALGGSIQNIITEDEETAKKMIGFLKKNRFGRATFLPLTSITRPQEFKILEALKEKGVIGLADTLVQTDVKYQNVAKTMLGRILVIDHIDNAVKIAKKYQYSIRIVTLEGELLVPGGAISGGAFKNSSNLLGRRRELGELEQKLSAAKGKLETALTDIENIKAERNQVRKTIEEKSRTARIVS